MITNDNRIGNYMVTIKASKKTVNRFQVPDLANAKEEATRIWHERNRKGLQTKRMFAQEIIGRSYGVQLSNEEHEL